MLRFLCVFFALLLPGGVCHSQAAPNADAQTDFAAHIQKAKQHLDEKRPDLAIPELEAAATIDPNSVETQDRPSSCMP
jgi:Tfp pilus assembly protein PilF